MIPLRNLVPSLRRRTDDPMKREEEDLFSALQREMNRLFDDFSSGSDISPFGAMRERSKTFFPSIDVKEDEKEMRVEVELPGMDEKDVEVLLTENTLTLKGEKKQEKEDKKKDYYHMERSYGYFNRMIPLPAGIDVKKVNASFKNGVLSVRLPKAEESKSKGKRIPVKVE